MPTSFQQELPETNYLASRTIAMPRDTNPAGDMFGGWLISQMDLAAGAVASKRAEGRTVTVAIDHVVFLNPVFVGDEVSCYAQVVEEGNTSLRIKVDVWVRRLLTHSHIKVTEGLFVFVAIDQERKPRPLPPKP